MNRNKIFIVIALAGLVSGIGMHAFAASQTTENSQTEEGRRHRGPPPEAIDACQGKSANASCNFTDREGEALTGKCFAPPARRASSASNTGNTQDERALPLACRPDRGGPGDGDGPDRRRSPRDEEL